MRRLCLAVVLALVARDTCAAVTVRSKAENVNVAASLAVTEPAACASGDTEVALALMAKGNALAAPAGWTVRYSGSSTTSFDFNVASISRTGSAPSLTWGGSTAVYHEIFVVCLTGAATVTLDSSSATGTTGTGLTNPDPPTTTAVAASSIAIAGGVNFAGSGTGGWTVSAGYTAQTLNANGDDGFMESKALVAAGVENPAALANVINSGDFWNGFTLTFTDVATTKPTRTLLGVGKALH